MEKEPFPSNQPEVHAAATSVEPTSKLTWSVTGLSDEGEDYVGYQGENGVYYLIFKGGRVATTDDVYSREKIFANPGTPDGQRIIAEGRGLEARDQAIHDLRYEKAKQLAGGEPVLERILGAAIEQANGGDPRPYVIDGVKLFSVGGNASHIAYLGVKDGRVYRFSAGSEIYVLPENVGTDIDLDLMLNKAISAISREWRYNEITFGDGQSSEDDNEASDYEAHGRRADQMIAEFTNTHGPAIRGILKPRLKKFIATGELTPKDNRIIIPLHDGKSITVYLKRLLHDVTDQDSVYVGRGTALRLKGDSPSDSGTQKH